MNAPTPPVAVRHIPLTRANYTLLLAMCDTEEAEWGRSANVDDIRRWLNYQWLLAQSEAAQPVEGCHQ